MAVVRCVQIYSYPFHHASMKPHGQYLVSSTDLCSLGADSLNLKQERYNIAPGCDLR